MTVLQLQCLLTYLELDAGGIDGIYGARTGEAVRQFQKRAGLPQTGTLSRETEEALKRAVLDGVREADFWGEIRYFRREEFACPCGRCGGFPEEPREQLVRLADGVREHFGKAALISSGVRCAAHNQEVGGVANSRHLSGKAMDFRVQGVSGRNLLAYVQGRQEVRYCYQINGSDYIHMDIA